MKTLLNKTVVLSFLAVYMAGSTALATDGVFDDKDIGVFKRIRPSSVTVRAGSGSGSGTIIYSRRGETLILTNYHVVEGEVSFKDYINHKTGEVEKRIQRTHKVSIIFKFYHEGRIREEKSIFCDVVAYDADIDLALLQPRTQETFPFLKVSETEPELYGTVWIMGTPLGLEHTPGKGRIVSTNREIRGAIYYQFDAGVTFGNSGGTVVNEKAELIGVPARVATSGPFSIESRLGFMVPLKNIRKFLNESKYAKYFK